MNLQNLLNLAHLHLLLNHWPIIGTFIGVGLFVVALIAKSEDLKKASLGVFSIIALFAIPTYTSGNAAYEVIRREETITKTMVDAHQGAALMSFIFMEITGAFAWLGLWQYRRVSRPASYTLPAVLFFSVVSVGLLTITGNTGGDIRHPEIRSGQETTSFVSSIGSALFSSTQHMVTDASRWVWPVLEDLHFLGLTLLLGTLGLLDLRILGFFKPLRLAPLVKFVPWAIAGFVMNMITGFLFFVGMPFFYAYNFDFHMKMFGVLFAGVNILLLFCTDAFRECDQLGATEEAPALAKFFAATSIFLVVAVIILGRYMPFFEDSLRPLN
ncbi:MAG TPA: hypothetical protein VE422_51360 [Terriglobia bacterium]|nr:hypothetical protein [Terriglobia bacterium]